jgi:ubiquinone/menaquinone biosynthesis C-methylase UbiE
MIDYDTIAAEYARHRKVHPGVLRDLLETGAIGRKVRVLEVGCGSGNYISAIRAQAGCSCDGIDPSQEMLVAARRQAPEVSFRVGTGEDLPYPDDTFDLAFSVDVIHHVTKRGDFFRHLHRVVKAGGRACTVTESEAMIRSRLHSHYFSDSIDVELRRYPSIPELVSLMERAGFTNIVERSAQTSYQLTDVRPYRDRAFSSLHLISDEAFEEGMRRLERDFREGPIQVVTSGVLLWGTR